MTFCLMTHLRVTHSCSSSEIYISSFYPLICFCLACCCSIWLLDIKVCVFCVSSPVSIESDNKWLLRSFSYKLVLAEFPMWYSGEIYMLLLFNIIFCVISVEEITSCFSCSMYDFGYFRMRIFVNLCLMFKFAFMFGVLLYAEWWIWSLEVLISFIKGWFCSKSCCCYDYLWFQNNRNLSHCQYLLCSFRLNH